MRKVDWMKKNEARRSEKVRPQSWPPRSKARGMLRTTRARKVVPVRKLKRGHRRPNILVKSQRRLRGRGCRAEYE